MRKRFINSAIAAAVAVTAIAVPVGMADFGLVDYGVIEDSSVSDIQTGDNYTISFVEGSSSSSDTDNVASLPSQLVIAKDADFMPDMISSVPSKDGYAFTGYYLDSSMTDQLTFYEPLDSISSSVNVYVQFTRLSTYKDNRGQTLNGEVTLSNYGFADSDAASDYSGLIWTESNGGGSYLTSEDINLNVTDSEISNYVELKVYGNEIISTILGWSSNGSSIGNAGYMVDAHHDGRNNTTSLLYTSAHAFTLTLTQDLTIKSGGSLLVGGTFGTMDNGYANSIDGDYFAIDLNGHTLTVENGGTLEIYGMICDSAGTGRVDVLSGGTTKINMVTRFDGFAKWSQAVDFKMNPYYFYGFPTTRAHMRIYAGAYLYGYVGGGVGSMDYYFESSPCLVGPSTETNSLLTIEALDSDKDAYLDFYNNMIPTGTSVIQTNNSWDSDYRSHFDFYNASVVLEKVKIELDPLAAFLGMTSVDSSTFLWNLPGTVDVSLHSSDLRIKHRFMLDPGFTFYSDEKSSVIFSPEDDDIAGIVVAGKVVDAPYSYSDQEETGHSLSTLKTKSAAEVTILGDVEFENATEDTCFLGGNINLSSRALDSILTAAESGDVSLKAEGGMLYLDWISSARTYNGIYTFFQYPLISNGVVYTDDIQDGSLYMVDNLQSSGIYTDGANYYSIFLDDFGVQDTIFDYTSSIQQVEYDDETHTYTLNGSKYLYYSGMSCPVISISGTTAVIDASAFMGDNTDQSSFNVTWFHESDAWIHT